MIMLVMMVLGMSVSAFAKEIYFDIGDYYIAVEDDKDLREEGMAVFSYYELSYGRVVKQLIKDYKDALAAIGEKEPFITGFSYEKADTFAELYQIYWKISKECSSRALCINIGDGIMLKIYFIED